MLALLAAAGCVVRAGHVGFQTRCLHRDRHLGSAAPLRAERRLADLRDDRVGDFQHCTARAEFLRRGVMGQFLFPA
jgi:hypothetical protein